MAIVRSHPDNTRLVNEMDRRGSGKPPSRTELPMRSGVSGWLWILAQNLVEYYLAYCCSVRVRHHSANCAQARDLWLIPFFTVSPSSAKVRVCPSGTKIGS